MTLSGMSLARQSAAPKAVIPYVAYSFGDISKGETVSYLFPIRNEGTADLLITDFVGACGCEVVSSDRVIPPGKQGVARVEVSTSSQPGGEMFKTALLHTNDPEHTAVTFTLMGNILTAPDGGPMRDMLPRAGKHIGPVFVSPGTLGGFSIPPGGKNRFQFTITVERGPLNVLRLEGETKGFTARLDTVEPGKRYTVTIENLPNLAEGTYTGQVMVITDSDRLASFPLNARVTVRNNL
jgi:hypothetical protein